MTEYRYAFNFSLKEADMQDFKKARERHKLIEIVRMGIKEALKDKGGKK
jgi:hypothetical protein